MSDSPGDRKPRPDVPVVDRRAAPGSADAAAPLRQLKGMLERPLRLAHEGGRLRVTLVDRRQVPADDLTWLLVPLRDELRSRLTSSPHGSTPQVLRHLMLVHKVLGQKGWGGLDALPADALAKALDQAEMLNGADASPLLVTLAERLRSVRAAVLRREQRQESRSSPASADVIEDLQVSEATHEEFEATQRSWFATLEAGGSVPMPLAPDEGSQAR